MKLIIILSLAFIFPTSSADVKKENKKYYYFATSRSMNQNDIASQKQYTLYTKLSEITCTEDSLKRLSSKWSSFVNERCMNQSGCTSDFNYYEEYDIAKREFSKIDLRYSNKSKFISTKVFFK